MTALFNQLVDFISWLYTSAQNIIDFINNMLTWLHNEIVIIQTVSNVVIPPGLSVLLGLAISFMFVMLVVKVVINLL